MRGEQHHSRWSTSNRDLKSANVAGARHMLQRCAGTVQIPARDQQLQRGRRGTSVDTPKLDDELGTGRGKRHGQYQLLGWRCLVAGAAEYVDGSGAAARREHHSRVCRVHPPTPTQRSEQGTVIEEDLRVVAVLCNKACDPVVASREGQHWLGPPVQQSLQQRLVVGLRYSSRKAMSGLGLARVVRLFVWARHANGMLSTTPLDPCACERSAQGGNKRRTGPRVRCGCGAPISSHLATGLWLLAAHASPDCLSTRDTFRVYLPPAESLRYRGAEGVASRSRDTSSRLPARNWDPMRQRGSSCAQSRLRRHKVLDC